MPTTLKSDWKGDELMMRMERAAGRAVVAIAMSIVAEAKVFVGDPGRHPTLSGEHDWTGTLRRSLHVATVSYDGTGDVTAASEQDIANEMNPTRIADGVYLEAGSWVPYACVEEVGRGHQFMSPAVDALSGGRADAIVAQAVREEGL
jgi:hypothetical protein